MCVHSFPILSTVCSAFLVMISKMFRMLFLMVFLCIISGNSKELDYAHLDVLVHILEEKKAAAVLYRNRC